MAKLNKAQRGWQRAALDVLLDGAGAYGRGPWVPADVAVAAIQSLGSCTHQAAAGALRALRTVGLADSCETSEGSFWKATDAAEHFQVLQGTVGEALGAAERATDLAERYGEAIVKVSEVLNDESVSDKALRTRLRVLLLSLDPEAADG